MECVIKKLSPDDADKLKQLLLVFRDVFVQTNFTMPPDTHLQNRLNSTLHLVFTASRHDVVVGGLTAYILPEFETESSIVYIYDLAVKTEHQRRGIGQQLIKGINEYCRQQDITEVFVQADEADDYAVEFYRKTGGKEMKVVQFSYEL